MTAKKPIREYDRFIVRLPDGLRERLSQRAVASGHSMNAEVVATLAASLDSQENSRVGVLAWEAKRLKEEICEYQAKIDHKSKQLKIITDFIAGVFKDEIGTADPVDYALKKMVDIDLGLYQSPD